MPWKCAWSIWKCNQQVPRWFIHSIDSGAALDAGGGERGTDKALRPWPLGTKNGGSCPTGCKVELTWCGRRIDNVCAYLDQNKEFWYLKTSILMRKAGKKWIPHQTRWEILFLMFIASIANACIPVTWYTPYSMHCLFFSLFSHTILSRYTYVYYQKSNHDANFYQ